MFLKGLYNDCMSQLRVNNCLGEECAVTTGLRQGCVLSPFVFSVHKQFGITVEAQRLWGSVQWNAGV